MMHYCISTAFLKQAVEEKKALRKGYLTLLLLLLLPLGPKVYPYLPKIEDYLHMHVST